LLLPLELPAVLLLFDPSLDVGADILHIVRRRELHEPVLIYAHLAERILLSSRGERVLLQLPPVNALFHLWAVTGLLGANGLACLLLVHIHPLLERVLIGVYAIQRAYDVPIDSELAMDFRVTYACRQSDVPMGTPIRFSLSLRITRRIRFVS
jgi:hypothetical protein